MVISSDRCRLLTAMSSVLNSPLNLLVSRRCTFSDLFSSFACCQYVYICEFILSVIQLRLLTVSDQCRVIDLAAYPGRFSCVALHFCSAPRSRVTIGRVFLFYCHKLVCSPSPLVSCNPLQALFPPVPRPSSCGCCMTLSTALFTLLIYYNANDKLY